MNLEELITWLGAIGSIDPDYSYSRREGYDDKTAEKKVNQALNEAIKLLESMQEILEVDPEELEKEFIKYISYNYPEADTETVVAFCNQAVREGIEDVDIVVEWLIGEGEIN